MIEDGRGSSSTIRTAVIETAPLLSAPYASRWSLAFPFRTTPPPERRPARYLESRARKALAVLRRTGADLPDDFAIGELKTAFRHAARRLHPDAHPDADPWLLQRLGAGFAELRDAYVVLLRIAQRPNGRSNCQ
jgi:hypothetical protein